MDEPTLRKYIDEVFGIYDVNKTGRLEPAELHSFYNDLFLRINDPRRYTAPEILIIFKEADVNHDGHVDKEELVRVSLRIFQKNPYVGTVTAYHPPVNHHYTYYHQRPVTTHVVFKN